MSKPECKRCGFQGELANGYCSMHCRGMHGVEQERDELKVELAKAEEERDRVGVSLLGCDEMADDFKRAADTAEKERDAFRAKLAEAEASYTTQRDKLESLRQDFRERVMSLQEQVCCESGKDRVIAKAKRLSWETASLLVSIALKRGE